MADRTVDHLLIGGGLAAGNCARWLRESGADGSILLVGREPDLPYNRPPCSKEYLQGAESRDEVLFRPPEWYEEQRGRGADAGVGDEARPRRRGPRSCRTRRRSSSGRRCSRPARTSGG